MPNYELFGTNFIFHDSSYLHKALQTGSFLFMYKNLSIVKLRLPFTHFNKNW